MWYILLTAIGLLLFLNLPFKLALFIFIPIVGAFLALMLFIRRQVSKAMKLPPKTGREGMVGEVGEVICILDTPERAKYLVRYEHELWRARSENSLAPGQRVRIRAVEGTVLIIEEAEPGQEP